MRTGGGLNWEQSKMKQRSQTAAEWRKQGGSKEKMRKRT